MRIRTLSSICFLGNVTQGGSAMHQHPTDGQNFDQTFATWSFRMESRGILAYNLNLVVAKKMWFRRICIDICHGYLRRLYNTYWVDVSPRKPWDQNIMTAPLISGQTAVLITKATARQEVFFYSFYINHTLMSFGALNHIDSWGDNTIKIKAPPESNPPKDRMIRN